MLTFKQLYDLEEEEPKENEHDNQKMMLYFIGLATAGRFWNR